MTGKKLIGRLAKVERVAQDLRNGLLGDAFTWPEWARKLYVPVAAELGCVLLTATALRRAGHRLKPRALPVGKVYFGAPLQRNAPVYIAGIHTIKGEQLP